MTDVINNTLEKFRVADKLPLFHIATAYGRVSFIAQQWRALTLANCLKQHFKGNEESVDLAIIGGGISGVTALVALHMHGFDKTRLFEAQEEVLGTHVACEHRHAHPSYNFWPFSPQEERAFPATTALPFLNWHADRVCSVIAQLKKDPFLCALEGRDDKPISPGKSLNRVAQSNKSNCNGEPKLNLRFFDAIQGKNDSARNYDAVIMATGFGQERNMNSSRSGSYWWSDHIKHFRSEHQHYASVKSYVSGNGDGALIDYARFRSKARNEFDRQEKNVALALMGELRPPQFRVLNPDSLVDLGDSPEARVKGIYEAAKDLRNVIASATDGDGHAGYDKGVTVFSEALESLAGDWTATKGADGTPVDDDSERIAGFLEDNFRERNGDVKLVLRRRKDKDGQPIQPSAFRLDATPANVVLTALLMKGDPDSHIVYGQVNAESQKLELDAGGTVPSTDIHVARNGTESWRNSIEFSGQLKQKVEEYDQEQGKVALNTLTRHVGAGHMQDHIIDKVSLDLTEYEPRDEILRSQKVAALAKARHRLAQEFFIKADSDSTIREMKTGPEKAACFVVSLADTNKAEHAMRAMGGIERNAYGNTVDFELEVLTGDSDPAEVLPVAD